MPSILRRGSEAGQGLPAREGLDGRSAATASSSAVRRDGIVDCWALTGFMVFSAAEAGERINGESSYWTTFPKVVHDGGIVRRAKEVAARCFLVAMRAFVAELGVGEIHAKERTTCPPPPGIPPEGVIVLLMVTREQFPEGGAEPKKIVPPSIRTNPVAPL